MKLKIKDKYLAKIGRLQRMNTDFNDFIDAAVSDLAKDMKLSGEEEEILWDHVLNNSTWMVEFEHDTAVEHVD
jgi:hypothetical protein